MVPQLCLYTCKECKLDPTLAEDRTILHILCFLVLGKVGKGDIVIKAESNGPFIPDVEEWCNQVKHYNY